MGRVDMQLSTAEVWELTPAQYARLWARQQIAEYRQDVRAAGIIAAIINVNRRKGVPITPVDIVGRPPGLQDKLKDKFARIIGDN